MIILKCKQVKIYILPTIAKIRRGICYYHIMNVWKNMVEIIMKKYPNAILTLNSAFYYYGLTDTIPDHYYIATPKSNRKIEDVRVKQIYENSNAFEMGKTTIEYDDEGASLLINSNEQMLSEKLRS